MAFADDNIKPNARRRKLVTITLSDPSDARDDNYTTDPGASPVLRFCDLGDEPLGYLTVGGVDYQPLIVDVDGNASNASWGVSGADGFGTLILANGRYPWQMKHSGGQVRATGTNVAESYQNDVKLSQVFTDYIVLSSAITIYAAVQSPGGTWTTSQRFTGLINQIAYDEQTISIGYIEDKSAVKQIPSDERPTGGVVTGGIVTKVGYPNAPIDSIGRSIPMVFSPETSIRAPEYEYGLACNPTVMGNLWPGVLTDIRDDGSYVGTIRFNKHDATMGNSVYNAMPLMWIPELATLAYMSSSVSTNNAAEDYTQINTNPSAIVYLNPIQNYTTGLADEGKAFDGNPLSYMTLVNLTQCLLVVPNSYPAGKIKEIKAFVILAAGGTGVNDGAGASSINARFGIWNQATAAYDAGFTAKTITKADVEDGGYFESVAMPTANMDIAHIRDWRWERTNGGVTQQLVWTMVGDDVGVSIRVICCGFKVTFVPQNLRFERRKKQRVPIIGVDGRLIRYEWV